MLEVSRAKTEHLQQTTGDTDPVRMKRYMETEIWSTCQQSSPSNILDQQ